MIDNVAQRLRTHFDKSEVPHCVLSVLLVGSFANDQHGELSDLDLVVIGRTETRITDLLKLRQFLGTMFQEILGPKFKIFAEPSYERTYYLDNQTTECALIHLIFHPSYRFDLYLSRRDAVVQSWKSDFIQVFGENVLKRSETNQIEKNRNLNDALDHVIQTIQNTVLIGDVSRSPLFFAKSLRYVTKRFLDCLSTAHFETEESLIETLGFCDDLLIETSNHLRSKDWLIVKMKEIEKRLLQMRLSDLGICAKLE